MEKPQISEFKIKKTKGKNRCLRVKKSSDSEGDISDEGDSSFRSILEDAKDIRKLRKRTNGVSAVGLALGKKLSVVEELVSEDPFKLKTGGFIDMRTLKGKKSGNEEIDAVNLGNTFSAETNRRDEDADMMKYIEEELGKKKGLIGTKQQNPEIISKSGINHTQINEDNTDNNDGPRKADDVLFEVPEHLRHVASKRSEEMLSNQMLSGIPEVDLGIDERIRNIEATEEAKQQLLRDRITKKEKSMSFVPTNIAVNFVQHNRFNIEDPDQPKSKKAKEAVPSKVKEIVQKTKTTDKKGAVSNNKTGKSKTEDEEKATDDFHFEKFKKQFRRF